MCRCLSASTGTENPIKWPEVLKQSDRLFVIRGKSHRAICVTQSNPHPCLGAWTVTLQQMSGESLTYFLDPSQDVSSRSVILTNINTSLRILILVEIAKY